ncbi:MAG: RnfABCDGE type electron transport complex subunit G [Clostridia bacterium]|nr:RnfABCDGE type electron transport complex subunit G [Clostridia bacterium]
MNKILSAIKDFYNKNKNSILKPSAVLLAICVVITAALGLTNKFTAPTIAELEKQSQQETMENIIKADEYLQKEIKLDSTVTYYEAVTDDIAVGYIFITSAKGYGGDVSVMTAIKPDATVYAVDILDASNETPGLGQNVTKKSFYSQFADKSSEITVVKNGAEGNQINAVTGATISSRAVTKAVNQALSYFNQISQTPKEAK